MNQDSAKIDKFKQIKSTIFTNFEEKRDVCERQITLGIVGLPLFFPTDSHP